MSVEREGRPARRPPAQLEQTPPERVPPLDPALQTRAAAARRLVEDGALDGPLALFLAVWPTLTILDAEKEA